MTHAVCYPACGFSREGINLTGVTMSVIYFIVLLGVLIFIHELGHYLAARAVGVSVTKFSLGFGPKIIGFTRGGTEFLLSAVPLGGYCKFLGDDPENPPVGEDRKKGFLTTDIWRRTLIVLAGPVFNLVLPLIVFLPAALSETELPPAVIGTAKTGGPAWEAGLRPGDRLVQIDREPVRYWHQMLEKVSGNPEKPLEFVVSRPLVPNPSATTDYTLKKFIVTPRKIMDPTYRQLGFDKPLGRIDAALDRALPIVMVRPDSIAARAGMKDFDAVEKVGDTRVFGYDELMAALKKNAGTSVAMVISPLESTETGEGDFERREITVALPSDPASFGISDGSFVISSLDKDGVAEQAGFRQGDIIKALNGKTFQDPGFMLGELGQDLDAEHSFTIYRGQDAVILRLSLRNPEWEPGSALQKYLPTGFRVRRVTVQPDSIPNDHILSWAFSNTWSRTADAFMGTVASVAALFTGKVSFKQMGGPIMIYDLAASAGRKGIMSFLDVLGWLSISLGVLNLLPIPVLDGGHLVLFAYEGVRRRPPTLKERSIWSWAGLAILVLIMAAVMKNDIMRKWG